MNKKVTISKINNGQRIMVQSPYNAEMLVELKAIEGRVWRPAEKAWSFKVADEAKVRGIVTKYFPGNEEEQEGGMPTSNILRYSDIVIDDVRSLLCDINENGGKVTRPMIFKHLEDAKGNYATDSANVALACIGNSARIQGGARSNEAQFAKLVAMAQKQEAHLIKSIEKKCQAAKIAKAEDNGSSPAKASKSRKAKSLNPNVADLQLPEGYTVRKFGRALKVVPAKAKAA